MSEPLHAGPILTPIFPVQDMEEARQLWQRTGVDVKLYDAGCAFVVFGGPEIAHLALHRASIPY